MHSVVGSRIIPKLTCWKCGTNPSTLLPLCGRFVPKTDELAGEPSPPSTDPQGPLPPKDHFDAGVGDPSTQGSPSPRLITDYCSLALGQSEPRALARNALSLRLTLTS